MQEELINILKNNKKPLKFEELVDAMNLKDANEVNELSKLLLKLEEDFIIFKTKKDKYQLLNFFENLIVGKISINKSGNGFLLLDKEDLFIFQKNLNGAIHGDTILCEKFIREGKLEGKVIKIKKREKTNIVGTIIIKNNLMYLKPDDDRIKLEIIIDKESAKNCVEGHIVSVILDKCIKNNQYIGKVVNIIAHRTSPQADILTIAAKNGIFDEFPKEVIAEINNIETEVNEKELLNRVDLTNKLIFTIDGDDTKDIDDAISLEITSNGLYRLGVHIADVSHYVKVGTSLYEEAVNRGTSSYLADTVIPMLPRKLSNGICSLNEGVIRLTKSCVMDIDEKGKVVNYEIFNSYIKSAKKMTYKKVNDILVRNIVDEDYKPFVDVLKNMEKLSKIIRKMKHDRGELDFEIAEAKIIQDENGFAVDIQKRNREVGEIIIEDFMIVANETVASTLFNMDLPAIYRNHDEPNPEKIDKFLLLIKQLGINLDGKLSSYKPKELQKLIERLKKSSKFNVLSKLLLRSMAKADYREYNIGHFGLASRCYTHFTSPIRRLTDLVVHSLLENFVINPKDDYQEKFNYYEENVAILAKQASEREIAAVTAERETDDMKMAEYMEKHIGEEYDGMITSLTNYGMYIELDNLVEGLVRVNTLKNDYFSYNEDLLAMIGKNSKKMYKIGDLVHIKVVAASKKLATIDFEIIEDRIKEIKENQDDRNKK